MLPVRFVYYGSAFIALGKTKAILYRSLIELIITAVLAYFLTKTIGYVGAAVATVSMYYIWAIPYNIRFLGKQFNCKSTYIINFRKIGFIFIISLIAGIIALPVLFIFKESILAISIGFILFITAYYFFAKKYVIEFNEIISQLLNKVKKHP